MRTNIQVHIPVLLGFPPKELNVKDGNVQLCHIGIRSGDTLIIEDNKQLQPRSQDSLGNAAPKLMRK